MGNELDFSLVALFLRASLIVQIVMVLLVGASIWSWAITFQKIINYRKAARETADFEEKFWSGDPLDDLYDELGAKPSEAMAHVFCSGMTEWRRSHEETGALIPGAQARIDRYMAIAISQESAGLRAGLSWLATIGSITPFIGLFGTVWGIKHAFEEIAIAQNTNLAVVAPKIAEALLATGLGLLAAIPAVVFYNKLSSDADGLTNALDDFADEFSTLLSRQLRG